MAKTTHKSVLHIIISTTAALSFLGASVTFVGTITFKTLPVAFGLSCKNPYPTIPLVVGIFLAIVAILSAIGTVALLDPLGPNIPKRTESNILFSRYLIGLGYFLFVDAIVNMVAFAGFASSGALDQIFPYGNGGFGNSAIKSEGVSLADRLFALITDLFSPDKRVVLTVILMLSLGMAVLGALFFFANALWGKFKSEKVIFDQNIFWGGLWFRLAEAVVLTIAIFLFFRFQNYNTNYLPILALFIGMTVKSSETLIFGLADRILAVATSLTQPYTPAAVVDKESEKNTSPVPAAPKAISPEELSDLIKKYFSQGVHKAQIKSIESKQGSNANTFLVTIKTLLPSENPARNLLIFEIKKMALSAVRIKDVTLEKLDVVDDK